MKEGVFSPVNNAENPVITDEEKTEVLNNFLPLSSMATFLPITLKRMEKTLGTTFPTASKEQVYNHLTNLKAN